MHKKGKIQGSLLRLGLFCSQSEVIIAKASNWKCKGNLGFMLRLGDSVRGTDITKVWNQNKLGVQNNLAHKGF